MKILLLDIETAPNTAYVWGLFKENIPLQRLVDTGYTMCWSAKWLGERVIHFDSVNRSSTLDMLTGIHSMIDEADAVIHYNGSRFDMPILNKEFLLNGLLPPAPYKNIDLLQVVRKQFRFTSNKLDHVAQQLGVGSKKDHAGFEMWVKCMAGDKKAWKVMEKYNIQDVALLEKVYFKILPWIKNHPNHGVIDDKEGVCPNCGSSKLHQRGTVTTAAGKYQRFHCQGCGKWSRGRKSQAVKQTLSHIAG